jgi:DnaJ family protein C protein 19
MATIASVLGVIGVGLAGRTLYQIIRSSKGPAERFVRGGFKNKMDRGEALQVLGLK